MKPENLLMGLGEKVKDGLIAAFTKKGNVYCLSVYYLTFVHVISIVCIIQAISDNIQY